MQKSADHAVSWIGLSSIQGVGRVTFRKLASHFGSSEQALSASADDLRNAGLSDDIVHEIVSGAWRKNAELEIAKENGEGMSDLSRNAGHISTRNDQPSLPREEEQAFRCISSKPKHIDSIMKECRSTAGMLTWVLISQELKCLVKQLPGKYYVLDEKS